jgi:hypothetical protein
MIKTVTSRHIQVLELYLKGESRKAAMSAMGISNPNVMSGISQVLNLHWSYPLSLRRNTLQQRPESKPRRRISDTMRKSLEAEKETAAAVGSEVKVKRRSPGRSEPLHRSEAFPSAGEDGLTAEDIRALTELYDKA